MKKFINKIFGLLGLEVRKKRKSVLEQRAHERTMKSGLQRFKILGKEISTIVDVGAAAGSWSIFAKKLWPESAVLMFEPLAERKDLLDGLTKTHSNFYFLPFAAGREKGEVKFVISRDLDGSGIASGKEDESSVRSVQVSSIAIEVNKLQLKGPYIIKLDTHGFEVPILEGCLPILDQVSLFIIECYGFQIADNSLLFWEMCGYMDKMGFRLVDVVEVMNRPKDGAFWQCDAFFIPKDNPLFQYNQYN